MKAVDQTRFGIPLQPWAEPPGKCFSASLASLLELPLAAVPDELEFWRPGMHPRKSWNAYLRKVHEFLYERGLMLLEVPCMQTHYSGPVSIFEETLSLLSGPSPRNKDVHHCVVGAGRRIAHDPHPTRAGLAGHVNDWWHVFLVPVTPPLCVLRIAS